MAIVMHTANVADFNFLPHPQQLAPAICTPAGSFARYHHPKGGLIQFSNFAFPHMHIMDLKWETYDDTELHDAEFTDTINISFQLEGNLYSQFRGIEPLDMRQGKHNLIYTPEAGGVNRLKGKEAMEFLHISLDKDFFISALTHGDRWSDRVREAILQQRPFSAVDGSKCISSAMIQLVARIRNCPETGPMRNLMLQSMILELLALQLQQFTEHDIPEPVKPEEADKLHYLKTYLDAHFLSACSLSELSRICLLNEFKIKKGFRKLFGTTVFTYLRNLRMNYAGSLLRNSRITVEEVADMLGYEHPQHFSIAFKKHTGLTPTSYRQQSVK